MNPPTLFDPVDHPHRIAYEQFRDANPWILTRLAHLARQVQARGYTHYGIAALVEVVRYEHAATNDPTSDFKINNNYTPFLARDLMARHPELDGFFNTRRSVADQL